MNSLARHFDGFIGRKCGLLLPPEGFVSSFNAFEDLKAMQEWTLNDIRDMAADGVTDGRKRFPGDEWIDDQGQWGSCAGYAAALALMRAQALSGVAEMVPLSGDYVYSRTNGGRDNGSMLEDGMLALMEHGVATKATVPLGAIYRNKYDTRKADAEAAEHKGWECYAVKTELGLYTAAAAGFVLVVAVHVGSDFSRLDSAGFAGSDGGYGNHAVGADGLALVGNELALTGWNSWGLRWGRRGRMLLNYQRHFRQTFSRHVFYAVRSVAA